MVRAEHGAHHGYSPYKRPDVVVFNEGHRGSAWHVLLEVKTLSTVSSTGAPKYGASEHTLMGGLAQAKRAAVLAG